MPRPLPLFPLLIVLPLLLAACGSVSSEQKSQLASYQHNARLYWEAGKLENSLGLIDKGLEIDPYDYQLRTLRGAILLRQSGTLSATDSRKLEAAMQELAEVYAMRSPSQHDPQLLFWYGRALLHQGMRINSEALRLRSQAQQSAEAADRRKLSDDADSLQRQARQTLDTARTMFLTLLERGNLPRESHKHLVQIADACNRPDEVVEHAKAYFVQLQKDRELVEKRMLETAVVGYEQELLGQRRALRDEEIMARVLLANFHVDRSEYEAALEHLDIVLQLDPTRSNDYYNRGAVLRHLGREEQAKNDYRKFLATSTLPATSPKKLEALRVLEQ